MLNGKQILGLIPARGGSKGIAGKNVKPLAGKPLVGWTVDAARGSRYLDRVVLSSDDLDIIRVAKEFGCEAPFVRPAELATDKASSLDVILHALDEVPGFDYFLLLQPTSPFRTSADIDACIEAALAAGVRSSVSVTPFPVPPNLLFLKDADDRLRPILGDKGHLLRRQDVAPAYQLNGALYLAESKWFREKRDFFAESPLAFEMPAERSLDIDTPEDWHEAERLLAERS